MAPRRNTRRRVVLYSGGQERRNALIHETLLDLALRRRRDAVRMTYMPYTSEGARPFYRRFERRYSAFGGTDFACVAADDPALTNGAASRRNAAASIRRSGIVVEGDRFTAHGDVWQFVAGQVSKIGG